MRSVAGPAARHQVEDAADRARDPVADSETGGDSAVLHGSGGAGDLVGERNRRLQRRAGERFGGADRDELVLDAVQRHLGRLERQDGVRAVAAGRHEQVVQMLDSRLRMERHDGVLELFGADDLDQVARAQHERVADREARRATRRS